MFSQMLAIKSIKPNPNYVPGGVENFWLTDSSTPEKKNEGKDGKGLGFTRFTSSYETEKTRGDETFQRPEVQRQTFGGVRRQ